eukprot:g56233.t1
MAHLISLCLLLDPDARPRVHEILTELKSICLEFWYGSDAKESTLTFRPSSHSSSSSYFSPSGRSGSIQTDLNDSSATEVTLSATEVLSSS